MEGREREGAETRQGREFEGEREGGRKKGRNERVRERGEREEVMEEQLNGRREGNAPDTTSLTET